MTEKNERNDFTSLGQLQQRMYNDVILSKYKLHGIEAAFAYGRAISNEITLEQVVAICEMRAVVKYMGNGDIIYEEIK